MPVGKTSAPPRQIIFLILATLVGIASMVFLFGRTVDLAQSGQVQLSIGDDVFAPGNVERLSSDIEKFGPLPFSDLAGRDRDIILQHIGDDPETGWYAFAIRPIDARRDCFVNWDPDRELFIYNCGDQTFPANGEGLRPYPLSIDADGNITIDLNAAEREASSESD